MVCKYIFFLLHFQCLKGDKYDIQNIKGDADNLQSALSSAVRLHSHHNTAVAGSTVVASSQLVTLALDS